MSSVQFPEHSHHGERCSSDPKGTIDSKQIKTILVSLQLLLSLRLELRKHIITIKSETEKRRSEEIREFERRRFYRTSYATGKFLTPLVLALQKKEFFALVKNATQNMARKNSVQCRKLVLDVPKNL